MKEYKQPLTTSRRDFLKNGSDADFREAIYAMVLAVNRLLSCRNAFGHDLGLTSSQFAVLMGVASQQKSKGVTIKSLAEHASLASTHVTTEVGRLERKGLVAKITSLEDRRSVLVSLTRKGETEIARVAPLVRNINDRLFRGIEAKALSNAHSVARILVLNSEEALTELRHHLLKLRKL